MTYSQAHGELAGRLARVKDMFKSSSNCAHSSWALGLVVNTVAGACPRKLTAQGARRAVGRLASGAEKSHEGISQGDKMRWYGGLSSNTGRWGALRG